MKERPILFSGPMVRAILEGRKTMTRRVIKPQPFVEFWKANGTTSVPVDEETYRTAPGWPNDRHMIFRRTPEARGAGPELWARLNCPYGETGDRLWVKETFTRVGDPLRGGSFIYREDKIFDSCGKGDIAWSWRPSIFMPRKASRITLEIVSVRVERLKDIRDGDAEEEGVYPCTCDALDGCSGDDRYRCSFRALWDSINAKRGYGWDANPWVWVVEFKGVES